MSELLILDTCVLPQKGGLHRNPLFSAMMRIAAIREFEVCIVDISRSESLSKRKREAAGAIERLRSAIADVGKYFEGENLDYYMPSSDDAVEQWREDLDDNFSIIETHGDDARAALHREAWRKVPAKARKDESATGSRDSAIWLSAKRKHLENVDGVTYFVSSNTSDFADRQNKTVLHEDLVLELGASSERFHYVTSISAVVDDLAEKSAITAIDFLELREIIDKTDMEHVILDALRAQPERFEEVFPVSLSVNAAIERRAYIVEEVRLSQVNIELASLAVAVGQDVPEPDRPVSGRGVIWLARSEDDMSFEIEHLELAGVVVRSRK